MRATDRTRRTTRITRLVDTFARLAAARNTLEVTLEEATPEVKQEVIRRCRAADRQVMNLTSSDSARLFVVRHDGQIVAWQGFDIDADPDHPESFSLFVDPAYRGIGVSHLLEIAKWRTCLAAGVKTLFVRIEAASNGPLLRRRVAAGTHRRVDPESLPTQWRKRCHDCHLFGTLCVSQAFLEVDVPLALARAEHKFAGLCVSQNGSVYRLRMLNPGQPSRCSGEVQLASAAAAV